MVMLVVILLVLIISFRIAARSPHILVFSIWRFPLRRLLKVLSVVWHIAILRRGCPFNRRHEVYFAFEEFLIAQLISDLLVAVLVLSDLFVLVVRVFKHGALAFVVVQVEIGNVALPGVFVCLVVDHRDRCYSCGGCPWGYVLVVVFAKAGLSQYTVLLLMINVSISPKAVSGTCQLLLLRIIDFNLSSVWSDVRRTRFHYVVSVVVYFKRRFFYFLYLNI